MWQGPKRSGKSTSVDIMSALLGQRNVCPLTLDDLAGRFGLEPLYGKTAAIISEATESRWMDGKSIAGRIKSITGEDRQNIDRKGRPSLTNILWKGHLTVLCNTIPTLTDDSGVLPSRMLYQHFPNCYLGREDRGLKDRLLTELPGILLWSLEGLKRLYRNGRFTQPEMGLSIKQDLENLTCRILPFLDKYFEFDPNVSIECDMMFHYWRKYCEETNNLAVGTATKFGIDLKSQDRGTITKKRDSAGLRKYRYHGVRLNLTGMQHFDEREFSTDQINDLTREFAKPKTTA